MTVDSYKVDAVIAEVDRRVARQLEAIRQYPPLRALERVWRALWYVVQHFGDAVVHMLQASKLESPRHGFTEYELIVVLHDFSAEDTAVLRELGSLNVPVVTSLPIPVGRPSES